MNFIVYVNSAQTKNNGDVAKWFKAKVCKTFTRRFESDRRLDIPITPYLIRGYVFLTRRCALNVPILYIRIRKNRD